LTPQRLEIIEIPSCGKGRPGAGDIFRTTREKIPNISMSTVYYTLNLLKEEGLIRELEFYEQEKRYESDLSDHVDLICVACGRIENYYNDVKVSSATIEDSTGFKAQKMRFEYYGFVRNTGERRHKLQVFNQEESLNCYGKYACVAHGYFRLLHSKVT
jgi:Fur family transcriptional regulator, peroxide stress response regulator